MLVTADHSHSFSLAGYMKRGTSILGFPYSPDALDGKNYTSLGYLTGPGGVINKIRPDMRYADTSDPRFKFQALVPTKSGTHSAEDVGKSLSNFVSHIFYYSFNKTRFIRV